MPKISIVVPIHSGMKHGDFFLWRLVQSLMSQTFKDYELVIVQEGKMAENTNAGINKAQGELIKVLYMDDYFAHKDALWNIVDNFSIEDSWLVTGCLHQEASAETLEEPHSPHYPQYTPDIYTGNNRIGSPSVLTLRRDVALRFDERLSFLLDCDLYYRLYAEYGEPKIVNDLNVVIGIGNHQTSHIMPSNEKVEEFNYVMSKYHA